MMITLELEVPLKLRCRVTSWRRSAAATGATLLGPTVRKEAGSCLQSLVLLSCQGAAKQVVPGA